MVKTGFSSLILILILVLQGLNALDKPSWDLSPNPVGVNDNFNLVIEINHPETREVEVPKQDYTEGIQLWRGPYIRPGTVKTKGRNGQADQPDHHYLQGQTYRKDRPESDIDICKG